MMKFHRYRNSCIRAQSTITFSIKTHFNELLATSGIIVLQRRCNYESIPLEDVAPVLLQAARTVTLAKFTHASFQPHLQSQLKSIIQRFVDDEISDARAIIELLSLCEAIPSLEVQQEATASASMPTEGEQAVIMAISRLIPCLYECHMKELSEAHLTTSYIHPFIHGLLSAKKPAKVAHCSNIVPDEYDNLTDRPDYKIDVYAASGYRFSYTNAFGEVKKSINISPTLIVKEFYRLCIFCKEALDTHNLQNVLAFQAVANTVTFVAMCLPYPHLYTMTELIRVKIPTRKQAFFDIIGHLDNLLFVALIYRDHCVPSANDLSSRQCPTLSSVYIDDVEKKLAPRKRPCNLTIDC
ncbi:hypothetical protein G6F57_011072 [Rhizopus arrhizus]|nr:hypothetical protein G6F23_012358 [Rhizopus arrhizus]KAG1394678.1 hypothetical protein G6F58_012085 [Rhizopus delemar]KAG0752851.1 hypothetical protein G6F24_013338 [Rhizopus arrhizus]KAG0819003.1 hypothetical protein G6F20_001116 [Rhizopus arrhizus]KAG0867050.1 hypothetical protein G6F16_009041 [Rhizopus arrhizus]